MKGKKKKKTRSAEAKPKPALSRRRRWAFRLLAGILGPLVFFTVLEVVLRLAGYGVDTAFTVRATVEGEDRIQSNPRFSWKYFHRSLARAPIPFSLPARKPAGTIRIFVLGESAAQGFPEPAFGIPRILDVLLQDRYPDVRFEVVNAAITAINSHAIHSIARDCAGLEPDLFVVYMGNNEVVGPYGPGTVFAPLMSSRQLIRASLAVKSTRTGQLAERIAASLGDGKERHTWGSMEMFLGKQVAASDPRLETTYRHFESNLRDICRTAHRAGVPVVLATVGVNVRDCAPLASLHREDLPASDLARWETLFKEGVRLEGTGRHAEAAARYEEASGIDDRYAELSFRLARCRAQPGGSDTAAALYEKALNLDALRFRADARINGIIRKVGAEAVSEGVYPADVEGAIQAAAPQGLPGREHFYEHVHMRFSGNYLAARTIADQIVRALPQLRDREASRSDWAGEEQCARRLPLTPLAHYDAVVQMLALEQNPPFTNQAGHDGNVAALVAEKQMLAPATRAPAILESLRAYADACRRRNASPELRSHCAGMLATYAGDPANAEALLRKLVAEFPETESFRMSLGHVLATQGKSAEAIRSYEAVLAIDPRNANAYINMAASQMQQQDRPGAEASCRKALALEPDNGTAHLNLGILLSRRGEKDEAIEHLEKSVQLERRLDEAHLNLGLALASVGRNEDAALHLRTALECNPDLLEAHQALGDVLTRLGRPAEAAPHYERSSSRPADMR